MKRKLLEKQLEKAKKNYKDAFNYISTMSTDIEEVEKFLFEYQQKIDDIQKELDKLS